MKKAFFAIVLLLLHHSAAAKRTYLYYFDSTLTFNQPSGYSMVKVIDMRADTSNFGKIGGPLAQRYLTTGVALSESLAQFGMQLTRNHPRDQTADLLVVLHHLSVVPTTKDLVSTVYADADFFSGQGGQFRFLFTADSFYESYSVAQREVWETQLEQIWYRYYDRASSATGNASDAAAYTEQTAVTRRADYLKSYPVYQTTDFPKGIYLTRESFLTLKPDLTDFKQWVQRDNPNHPYTFFRVNANGKRGSHLDDSSFYAVYDGKYWYKSGQNSTYRMSFENGDFYFDGKMEGIRGRENQAMILPMAAGAGLFGILLVVVAGGLATTLNNAHERSALKKHPTEVRFYKIRLDALNDRYVPVERQSF